MKMSFDGPGLCPASAPGAGLPSQSDEGVAPAPPLDPQLAQAPKSTKTGRYSFIHGEQRKSMPDGRPPAADIRTGCAPSTRAGRQKRPDSQRLRVRVVQEPRD